MALDKPAAEIGKDEPDAARTFDRVKVGLLAETGTPERFGLHPAPGPRHTTDRDRRYDRDRRRTAAKTDNSASHDLFLVYPGNPVIRRPRTPIRS
jgi:hypothetical protein